MESALSPLTKVTLESTLSRVTTKRPWPSRILESNPDLDQLASPFLSPSLDMLFFSSLVVLALALGALSLAIQPGLEIERRQVCPPLFSLDSLSRRRTVDNRLLSRLSCFSALPRLSPTLADASPDPSARLSSRFPPTFLTLALMSAFWLSRETLSRL